MATCGDIIGRSRTAAISIPDPRVSVAHAMLDIRNGKTRLFRLRRSLYFEGAEASSVILKPGIKISLSPDGEPSLLVTAVQHPTHVLILTGLGPDEVELYEDLAVLPSSQGLRVVKQRYNPRAIAHIYCNGDGNWDIDVDGELPETLFDGWEGQIGEQRIRAQARRLGKFCADPSTYLRLKIRNRFDSVQIDYGSPAGPFVLGGKPARILSEVISCKGLVSWEAVAREIWTGEIDQQHLRWRVNRHIQVLRKKLGAAGLPPDLLLRNGDGNLELNLGPNDTVIDDT